jgi:hypothetical protein
MKSIAAAQQGCQIIGDGLMAIGAMHIHAYCIDVYHTEDLRMGAYKINFGATQNPEPVMQELVEYVKRHNASAAPGMQITDAQISAITMGMVRHLEPYKELVKELITPPDHHPVGRQFVPSLGHVQREINKVWSIIGGDTSRKGKAIAFGAANEEDAEHWLDGADEDIPMDSEQPSSSAHKTRGILHLAVACFRILGTRKDKENPRQLETAQGQTIRPELEDRRQWHSRHPTAVEPQTSAAIRPMQLIQRASHTKTVNLILGRQAKKGRQWSTETRPSAHTQK